MKCISFVIPLIVSVCIVTASPGLARNGQEPSPHETPTLPPETPLVTQEIRYRAPEAGEVWLVWGVNGWKHVPESLRPPMTVVKDGVMHTSMVGKSNLFVATIRVHTGTIINYGFLTTKDRMNAAVKVWQGDGPTKDFPTVAKSDGSVEIPFTTAGAAPSQSSSKASDTPLVTQEIRYRTMGVDAAWFVWGVNGWQHIPEDSRPPGTTIRNNVMHTPMVSEEQAFVIKIHVSRGTRLDYGFLTAVGGVKFWQDNAGQDYHTITDQNGTIDIESTAIASDPGTGRKPFQLWPYVLAVIALIAGGAILLVLHRRPARNSVRIVCFNLVFLLLGLLVIELVFGRWINPHTLYLLNVPRNVELSFNVSHLYSSSDPVVTYRRDQYGLRGQFDHTSSIDILTVGGSTTDQRSLDEGSTWQDILREEFKSHGKKISVVNAGVDGQSTYGHAKNFDLWFPHIPDLRVRYLLFYVGINDFWADHENTFDKILEGSHHSPSKTLAIALADRSALYYLYRTIRGMFLARVVFRLDHHHVDWEKVRYVDRPKISDHQTFMRERIAAYEKRLQELAQRTRQFNATPVFVTQVYRSYKSENGKILGSSTLRSYGGVEINGVDLYRIMDLINNATMKVCSESNSMCIDLAKELTFEDEDFLRWCSQHTTGGEEDWTVSVH